MQRIKLLKSQKVLLQMKLNEITIIMQAKQKDFRQTLNIIAVEQGVPEKEVNEWQLGEDGQAIEKTEPKKPPKEKDKK